MTRMTSTTVVPSYQVRARNLVPDSDNKIHDDDVAQRFGFSGALVPGVEVFAYAVHPFVAAWGTAFFDGGRLAVRFRRPVYDGDLVEVVAEAQPGDSAWGFRIAGADGEVRATGTAHAPLAVGDRPDASRFPVADIPADPPPADAHSLAIGTVLGTIVETATPSGCADYLAGIGETSPRYAGEGIVHPGLLLRMVNASLFRNVALGPWIHTESDCTFLGIALVGVTLSSRAIVTGLSSRNGNDYVHYDALVLADDDPVMLAHHTAIYRLGTIIAT
jgi:acyl dehydratase